MVVSWLNGAHLLQQAALSDYPDSGTLQEQ